MAKKINILFLTHYFPPEVNAPANRTYEHAKIWVENGVDVTVITNNPHHPHGKVFTGYVNRNNQENVDGIKVVRLKAYMTPNAGFFKRILNYINFMFRAIWQALNYRDADIIFATSPQFFCGFAGALLSKLLNKPFILEVRDIWPESIISVGLLKNRYLIRILEQMEKWMVLSARQVVVVTNGIEKHIRLLGHSNTLFVPNGVLLSKFKISTETRTKDPTVVAYFGTIGLAHNVDNTINAARRIRDNAGVKFIIAGDGSERENIIKLSADLENMKLYPLLSRKDLLSLLKKIDIGIVSLNNKDLFQGALPSKMFEYLAMEKPVIVSIPEGEATQLIRENNCGLVVSPENDKELARAIIQYANDPGLMQAHGQNGRTLVENKFNRERLAQDMLSEMITEVN